MDSIKGLPYTYVFSFAGVPVYVGKGTHSKTGNGERCLKHFAKVPATKWQRALAEFTSSCVDFEITTFDAATDEEAVDLEKKLIAKYGRRDLGTGTLYNLNNGGQGGKGAIRTPEWRAALSKAKRDPSAETRAKHSAARLGKKHTAESRALMSEKRKGHPSSQAQRDAVSRAAKIRWAAYRAAKAEKGD